jgi:hypothetical protein
MIGAMAHTTPFRFVALVMVTVLLVLAATPARAEALEALTIVAIVGLALAGIILIAYLIVANVEGKKSADAGRLVWVACASDACTTVPAETAAALAAGAEPAVDRQGP